MSNGLEKIREKINKIDDLELLEVAKELLSEMSEIYNLKQQIELREEKLTEGKKAAFYFYAASLDAEELAHATNTATGRLRFLREKAEREGRPTEEKAEIEDGSVQMPSGFGGLGSSFK